MKFAIALCLLLATSGFALVPKHSGDLISMLTRQQFAVRTLMAAPEARDESTLISDCFNHYLEEQTNVIMGYNQQYTGCLRTAQMGRDELTNESASEREALLDRTNSMCSSLTKCDELVDGLKFFDCYRNASSDSYKVMFTLNSDSSLDFNRISAKYSVIETDLTACVDMARVDYAHDMDSCDESLTVCLNGGESPSTAAPTTAAPTTAAPTTAAPTTAAPTTAAPTTAAPTTAAPTTADPTTAAPTTADPTTAAPTTAAPTTAAPTTAAPTTAAPTTAAPTTAAPTTAAPTTDAPTTAAPTTAAPTTAAPTTAAPTTDDPTTAAPTTAAPTTAGPTTAAPTTDAPTTAAPTTAAPTTAAPTTAAPTTAAPTTAAPTTAAPTTAAPTTAAPTTVAPTTERPPEEDINRSIPLSRSGVLNLMKRFF
ncbi:salivary glue protein Sgs-3 [Drosophila elegans]|uniref:salivary glue protein Sgs-3 n=1 Tax=Drosophila elegans TaxID=30023 RepID=UPI001BC84BBE|nr:salivary glue protein Sgs-3 [Drosophila elegans]